MKQSICLKCHKDCTNPQGLGTHFRWRPGHRTAHMKKLNSGYTAREVVNLPEQSVRHETLPVEIRGNQVVLVKCPCCGTDLVEAQRKMNDAIRGALSKVKSQ